MFKKIKEVVSLQEHIGQYVELGHGNPMKGLCPFHPEKTASFCVYSDHWYCYGACCSGGSVIDFEMRHKNLTALDAARSLCAQYDISVSSEETERFSRVEAKRREKADILAALPLYIETRPDLMDYLRKERGFSDQTIKDLGFGVATRENALIVPIRDKYGRPVAFARRIIDYEARGCPKWINDAEDEVYKKGDILYNFDHARRHLSGNQRLILAESYWDVAALWEVGIKTGAAYCSARVTNQQVQEIKALNDQIMTIVFAAANDKTAQDKLIVNRMSIHTVAPEVHIRAIVVPDDCKDLNDVLVKHGAERLRQIVADTIPMDRYLLDQVLASEPDQEVQYRKAKQIISIAENPLSQRDLIDYLAQKWGKSEEAIASYMLGSQKEAVPLTQFHKAEDLGQKYLVFVREGLDDKVLTGYEEIDKKMRGIKPGEVLTIIAGPGVGKTAYSLNLICNVQKKQQLPTIFFSLEQALPQIVERLVTINSPTWLGERLQGQDVENIFRDPKRETEIRRLIANITRDLSQLIIVDRDSMSIAEIEAYCQEAALRLLDKPLSLVVIDYLGYIKGEGFNIYEEVSKNARALKGFAKRLNGGKGCAVIVLHQVNKAGQSGAEEVSGNMARDSGAVLESCDYMLGLWRPALGQNMINSEKETRRNELKVKIIKNRNGEANVTFDYYFDLKTLAVTEIEKRNESKREAEPPPDPPTPAEEPQLDLPAADHGMTVIETE